MPPTRSTPRANTRNERDTTARDTIFARENHTGAERYWVAALRAAHAADDRALGANILKCMSLQRVDAGRPDEAVSLAQAARAGAQGAPSRVIAMLTLRQARAHAVRGEASESERLLAKADRAMAQADGGHDPLWARYFDHAEYCAQVAACYLALGRHPATERWLSQSFTLQPKERSRDRATYLMWQARTALSLGDVERACSVPTLAIPDISATRSMRNKRRLSSMHPRLRPYRQMAPVQELDERIKELIA